MDDNIIKQVYYDTDKNSTTLGILMMVKNEEKRIETTLNSIKTVANAIIVYDTGSEDNTISIIEKFCETNKINLLLKKGVFVDFSTSRNVSLDLADSVDVHYILLMDCNDELRGDKELKKVLSQYIKLQTNAFLVCQEWFSGLYDKYFNIRLVKNRCGWRYRGAVHEWMKDTTVETHNPRYPVVKLPNSIVLFQDRTKDDDKSSKRFIRDREILLAEHLKDPKESRTVFYLAQTCDCLKLYEEAYKYSKLRTELEGFEEERFHSFLRCGNISKELRYDWNITQEWYLKAYIHSRRAEPLVKIADYYRTKNQWNTAYLFCKEACELDYPSNNILFVDKTIYDYFRWHILSIVAYYVQKYEEGKEACLKSLEKSNIKDLEKKNLQFYIDKEKVLGSFSSSENLKQKLLVLKGKFQDVSINKVQKLIKEIWKK
jgi:glycosyltransferase involved in cell wall biosynthesis